MFQLYSLLNESAICQNSSIAYGADGLLGASIKSYHRIVYFEYARDEIHYIDFVPHKIEACTFYIIPSGHFYFLPYAASGYNCIDVPVNGVSQLHKQVLFKIKYLQQKGIGVSNEYFDIIRNESAEVAVHLILEYLIKNFAFTIYLSDHYLKTAQAFHQFIHQNSRYVSLSDILTSLCITRKTLLRVCNEVYGKTPKFILRYHLYVFSVAYILFFPNKSFAEIAETLGFKEASTFSRYIKSISGKRPKELRQRYASLLIQKKK